MSTGVQGMGMNLGLCLATKVPCAGCQCDNHWSHTSLHDEDIIHECRNGSHTRVSWAHKEYVIPVMECCSLSTGKVCCYHGLWQSIAGHTGHSQQGLQICSRCVSHAWLSS